MCKNYVVLNKHLKNILYPTKMGSSTTYNNSILYVSSQTIFCTSNSTFLLSLGNGFNLDFGDPYTDFFLQRLKSSIKI